MKIYFITHSRCIMISSSCTSKHNHWFVHKICTLFISLEWLVFIVFLVNYRENILLPYIFCLFWKMSNKTKGFTEIQSSDTVIELKAHAESSDGNLGNIFVCIFWILQRLFWSSEFIKWVPFFFCIHYEQKAVSFCS